MLHRLAHATTRRASFNAARAASSSSSSARCVWWPCLSLCLFSADFHPHHPIDRACTVMSPPPHTLHAIGAYLMPSFSSLPGMPLSLPPFHCFHVFCFKTAPTRPHPSSPLLDDQPPLYRRRFSRRASSRRLAWQRRTNHHSHAVLADGPSGYGSAAEP